MRSNSVSPFSDELSIEAQYMTNKETEPDKVRKRKESLQYDIKIFFFMYGDDIHGKNCLCRKKLLTFYLQRCILAFNAIIS